MAAKTIYLGTDFSPASERAFDEALAMAKLRGATISLRKPFSPPQLVAAIDRSLGRTFSTRESAQ